MTVSDQLSAQIHSAVGSMLGSTGERLALGWLTVTDLAVILIALIVAALCQLELELYLRRQQRSGAQATAQAKQQVGRALARPLAALIWVYCLYLAVAPVLGKIMPGRDAADLRQVVDTVFDLLAFSAAWWFLFRLTHGVEARLRLWLGAQHHAGNALLVALLGTCLRILIAASGIAMAVSLLVPANRLQGLLRLLDSMVLIVALALLLSRTVNTLRLVILTRFDTRVADNLRARQINTQLHIICRIIYVIIAFLAIAAILMLFPSVRHVGTSLLASAGIAGIVAGLAAQKVLGNLLAGVQIALAQTLHEDDVLVVEGEWGRVEDITLSYVVLHLWDDRRLVLPLSYFIEKPFQNWTHSSAQLTGAVTFWLDFAADVESLRAALKPIVEDNKLWDKRFWNLQVTDVSDKCMQVRVLATSADSSSSSDLRCEIRERLLAFLRQQHPEWLPRVRQETQKTAVAA